jgi:hypothetical protein
MKMKQLEPMRNKDSVQVCRATPSALLVNGSAKALREGSNGTSAWVRKCQDQFAMAQVWFSWVLRFADYLQCAFHSLINLNLVIRAR